MVEGTGMGLYILIGAILFGLFTASVTTLGGEVHGFRGDLNEMVKECEGYLVRYQQVSGEGSEVHSLESMVYVE